MRTWKKILLLLIGGMAACTLTCLGAFGPCWSGWFRWGVLASECPVGVRPVVQASVYGMGRGVKGTVSVGIRGELFDATLRSQGQAGMSRADVSLILVSPDGSEQAVRPLTGFSGSDWQTADVVLPKDLADGDYLLKVSADTPAGVAFAEVRLPLFRPALTHVLTSAPLFKPGQTIQFRAVLLEKGSLKPLAQRPGRWMVTDPTGEVLLEEKARTDDWGIAASDFPLADDAPTGPWKIEFRSGDATDAVGVEVKQFQLPKMVAELASHQAYWRVGESPALEGTVRYASGAPIANASLRLRVDALGGWPPPTSWGMTEPGVTDASGAFRLVLDPVPEDVTGVAKAQVTVEATDATGETVRASATLVLTLDPLAVEAVTELGGGLVPDMNNRLFVRVTTPDGRTLPERPLRLRPAWDPTAPWMDATTDADGVARFQLDPGAAVTVTEPANPVRPPPPRSVVPVAVTSLSDRLDGDVTLAERAVVDRWARTLTSCAAAGNGTDTLVDVMVGWTGGRRVFSNVVSSSEAAQRCVSGALAALASPGVGDSLLQLTLSLNDPGSPWLTASVSTVTGGASPDLLTGGALLPARACVRGSPESGQLPGVFTWTVDKGASVARATLLREADISVQERALLGCVEAALGPLGLPAPASGPAAGTMTVSVNVRTPEGVVQPAPLTWPGFEFVAQVEGVGETNLRVHEGNIPALRLRLDEVIVDPGSSVGITALRGPDFRGDLPKKMELMQGDRVLQRFDMDPDTRKGTIQVPADATGFASVQWQDARAVVYVRPKESLEVELTATGASWKPGSTVDLLAKTTNHGAPVAAGLTLSGIDSTMGQLAALVPADDFSRVTVLATMETPAFGVLDAKALQSGSILGDNAQQATVLRIASLPPVSPAADAVSGEASSLVDLETPLAASFYELYRVARKKVRAWESAAPPGEQLTNDRMVDLWGEALQEQPAEDPFGRSLRLRHLPPDLLGLADPRVMVADAARLPEDIEDWATWVAKERP